MTTSVETIKKGAGVDRQSPFKSLTEIEELHRGKIPGKIIDGIFRTEVPNEPRGSITFAEAITGQRFHTWTVPMKDGEKALELVEELHAWHKHAVALTSAEVTDLITRLGNLNLQRPSPNHQTSWYFGSP